MNGHSKKHKRTEQPRTAHSLGSSWTVGGPQYTCSMEEKLLATAETGSNLAKNPPVCLKIGYNGITHREREIYDDNPVRISAQPIFR